MARSKAVIWDMDGVIADTAPYHFQAWREVFRKRGVDFTEADFKRNFGQRNDTIIRNTLGQQMSLDVRCACGLVCFLKGLEYGHADFFDFFCHIYAFFWICIAVWYCRLQVAFGSCLNYQIPTRAIMVYNY